MALDLRGESPMAPPKEETVTVYGKILHRTSAAILIEVEGTGIWFPYSTVSEIHENSADVWNSHVVVSKWIADKKGVG